MSDADVRLERLERLTRLRDSGALSAEEFAVEKRRVLIGEGVEPVRAPAPAPAPAPARQVAVEPLPVEPVYDATPAEPRRRRLPVGKLLVGVVLASAAGAAIFINTTPSEVPGRSVPKARPAPRAPVVPASVTPPAGPVDLSSALRFSDADQCVFASGADELFDRLLPRDETGVRAASPSRVSFAGVDLAVAASDEPAGEVSPAGRKLRASVRFPEGTRWNALKISRIVREHGDYPESDDTDTRMVTFLNSAGDLQSALKNAGVSVPVAPKFRDIDDSGGSCGGTMQVLPITGGSALICNWGC